MTEPAPDQHNHEAMWAEEYPFAERLAKWIHSALNPTSVIDLGCGPGMYVAALQAAGVLATGYDIDPRTESYNGERFPFNICDSLIQRDIFAVNDPASVTLCLEVAEHIPAADEGRVAETVARNTFPGGTLIWSAAHPGQGGVGHINCQPKEHWAMLLTAAGFRRDYDRERDLLQYITWGYHMGWFRLNAMVFVKGLAP